MESFVHLDITNTCVLVCELARLKTPDAAAWCVLRGTQEEIGSALAAAVAAAGIARLDDFGGVAKTFLCDGDAYRADPPRTREAGAIYSFTPKNKAQAEAPAMAESARRAGYALLILTVRKDGKYGKVWTLSGMLRHFDSQRVTYYEDTGALIDELKALPEGAAVHAVHVLAPGFEEHRSILADRTVTQEAYRAEVLASA
jgi:hypothetical protein